MSCCQCRGAESVFSGFYVARDLKSYRRKGPRRTTTMLIDALRSEDIVGATLLDIGGGVGAIQHELLKAGAASATGADASTAYLDAARKEAERQGHADRVHHCHGDFVCLADEVDAADVVTLDRVICCYHDMRSLVSLSVGKAGRLYGLVYPRDVWWTRAGHRFLNLYLWLFRNPFRVFMHAEGAVDAIVRAAGFERRYHRSTASWQVVVYARPL